MNLATILDAIPVVQSTLDRTTKFPAPLQDQRVYNKGTKFVERFNLGAWVQESYVGGSPAVSLGWVNIQDPAYGAVPDNGITDNKVAIDAALTAATASGFGTIVYAGPGKFGTSGAHIQPKGVTLVGAGKFTTWFVHSGNNTFVDGTETTGLANLFQGTRSFQDFTVIGNGGAAAKGIVFGNGYGTLLDSIHVQDYTAGEAIRIQTTLLADAAQGFTEGSQFRRVHCRNSLYCFRFVNNGGATSFSETQFYGCTCAIDFVAGSTGIDVGANVTIYASYLDVKFNCIVGTTCVRIATSGQIVQSRLSLVSEGGGTGLNLIGNAILTYSGLAYFPGATNTISTTAFVLANDLEGWHTVGTNGELMTRVATATGLGDGDLVLLNGQPQLSALVSLRFFAAGREHRMTFRVEANQFDPNPNITIISDIAYSGLRVFSEPFVKRLNADGSNPHLIVTLGNRNGGSSVLMAVTFFGGMVGSYTTLAQLPLFPAAAGALAAADPPRGITRQSIDGWYQNNVVANQANVVLTRLATTTEVPNAWIAPRKGCVTGVWVKTSNARTAGTLTIKVFSNGVQLGTMTAVLDGTNTIYKATTQARITDVFSSGDELDLRITTDAGWLPVTANIRAGLEIET